MSTKTDQQNIGTKQKAKNSLLKQLEEDINDLPTPLRKLVFKGLEKGYITEDEILANVDDLDEQVEDLEKFYDICEKLSIKVITIEEALANQKKEEKKL
jgi:hypothetical protein